MKFLTGRESGCRGREAASRRERGTSERREAAPLQPNPKRILFPQPLTNERKVFMKEKYRGKLPDRDIEVLTAIYQLQAVAKNDLVDVFYGGRGYGEDRLQQLCIMKYLERSYKVRGKGSEHPGQANGTVYSVTDLAIAELLRVGKISQPRRARDLKLPTQEMLLRIEVSKIAVNLEKAGWGILGSMDGKQRLGLPPTSPMQLALTTPEGKTYRVYVLNRHIQDQTLVKLVAELGENKSGSIVLYKADTFSEQTPAYLAFVNEITERRTTPYELCLIPMVEWRDEEKKRNFSIEALANSDDGKVEQYLRKRYGRIKYSDNRYHFGNIVVEQDGKEYMVCNYLRRDHTALHALARNLTISEYQNMGKGAVVLTWNGLADEAQQILDSYQSRGFIKVEGITVHDILSSQTEAKITAGMAGSHIG